MKRKLAAILLVMALAVSFGVVPAVSVNADDALPSVVWLPPLANQGEFQLKDGSTLPIKFTLLDSEGSFVEDTGVHVDVNKVLFQDDFEAETIGDPASKWTTVSGNWKVELDETTKVYSVDRTASPNVEAIAVAGIDWENYVLEYRVKIRENGVEREGSVFVRADNDASNGYLIHPQVPDGHVALWKRVSGSYTLVNTSTWDGIQSDVWYNIKVIADGANIKVYVDGSPVIDWTDTSPKPLMNGRIGLRLADNRHAHFDDVMVLARPAAKTFSYGDGSDNVRISYDTVFSENFDDGDYSGWSPAAGDTTWSVTPAGVLYNDGSVTYPRILADATLAYGDYVVEADARLISGPGYALLFRATDYNNFYSFQYDPGAGLRLRLYQFANFPSGADVAPMVPYPIDYEWHHLKVVVVANNIKCYVDGNKVFDVTDTVPPAPLTGGIGFRTWGSAQAEFDNVSVQVGYYIANLHTKENGMSSGDYLITVWSGDNQLGTYLVDLTDAIQGKGRGKGKA